MASCASCRMARLVSTSWPSTRPAMAALARPAPMAAATAATETGPGNSRRDPSGSVTFNMFLISRNEKTRGLAALCSGGRGNDSAAVHAGAKASAKKVEVRGVITRMPFSPLLVNRRQILAQGRRQATSDERLGVDVPRRSHHLREFVGQPLALGRRDMPVALVARICPARIRVADRQAAGVSAGPADAQRPPPWRWRRWLRARPHGCAPGVPRGGSGCRRRLRVLPAAARPASSSG